MHSILQTDVRTSYIRRAYPSADDHDGENICFYRGISKNTETGVSLYGHYGTHGYTGVLNQTESADYMSQ